MFDVGHDRGSKGRERGGGGGEVGTRAGPGAEAVIHAVAVLTLILRAFEENTGARDGQLGWARKAARGAHCCAGSTREPAALGAGCGRADDARVAPRRERIRASRLTSSINFGSIGSFSAALAARAVGAVYESARQAVHLPRAAERISRC